MCRLLGFASRTPTTLTDLLGEDAAEIESRLTSGGTSVILGGAPIREPIAMYGPFVMNTRQEVMDAFTDFQAGRLGSIPATYVPHGAVRGESGQ